MTKIQDLRNESSAELELKVSALKREILKLRSARLENKSKQTHLIGAKRKDIARILTIKKERALAEVSHG